MSSIQMNLDLGWPVFWLSQYLQQILQYNSYAAPGKSYTWEGSLALKNWKNLFGDQREDSLTSLEVCYLLEWKQIVAFY